MARSRIDLHCHSTASDGDLPPQEVVALAASEGVATLSLTDHDTFGGQAEAAGAAAEHGIRFIPGIELSVKAPSGSMHLLGYFPSGEPQPLADTLDEMKRRRADRARIMVGKLNDLGVPLDYADVEALAGGPVGRPHVAEALVAGGFVADRQDAFDRYLADDAPAAVPHAGLTPTEAVQIVRRSGGAPVLAHPNSLAMPSGQLGRFVADLATAGLVGIEVFRPEHTDGDRSAFTSLADLHGLVRAGGSDFHRPGEGGLGATGSPPLPDDTADRLLDRAGAPTE